MQEGSSPDSSWIWFVDNANRFLQETQEHVLQGINPGGFIRPYSVEMPRVYSKRTGFYLAILMEQCSRFIRYGRIRWRLTEKN
jgi:hypothetical protein